MLTVFILSANIKLDALAEITGSSPIIFRMVDADKEPMRPDRLPVGIGPAMPPHIIRQSIPSSIMWISSPRPASRTVFHGAKIARIA